MSAITNTPTYFFHDTTTGRVTGSPIPDELWSQIIDDLPKQDLLQFIQVNTYLNSLWYTSMQNRPCWKHVVQREKVRYEPGQWSMVFPLGMYTASTEVFSRAAGLAFLRWIPLGFFWFALLAWGLAAFGLVRWVGRSMRGR